jgi:Zn ribbon nucleic-acid-binding protein
MQAKCPKCEGTAFRMLPDSPHATEVECLNCGHVAPFVATVTRPDIQRGEPAHYTGEAPQ